MKDETYDYQAYMLRLWQSEYKGQWQWHASLESPHTGERQTFADLEQLFVFLSDQCKSQIPHRLEKEDT